MNKLQQEKEKYRGSSGDTEKMAKEIQSLKQEVNSSFISLIVQIPNMNL